MEGTEFSIVILAAILFGIIALFVVVRGLQLPKGFIDREKQRTVLRRRMLEMEMSQKDKEKTDTPEGGGSSTQQRH
jgi:hypothetical protein